ncbi:MAG TPA: GIY-YIG nuclease family protein [Candidatus Paceibacterota bacterium]|nr:GIY-YIG nuclease family protein [Candidatus Paceibacterota bacterium]
MYHVYIVTCADGTLYTGIATDLERRMSEHNSSDLGAKYTRTRRPVRLSYSEPFADRSVASREEYRLKQLSRTEKLALVKKGKKKHG